MNVTPILHHASISSNSIDFNAATSLSDDSGLPHTTNSSISSNDSCRLGAYKSEVEVMESDGDVSQFNSFDNCSEIGMSAEIFNTLKKVPLAPIDPPPEFQDSPRSTMVKNMPKSVFSALRRWTSSQSSFEHLRDNSEELLQFCEDNKLPKTQNTAARNNDNETQLDDDKTLKEIYTTNHLYSSDSILTSHSDNIYDEPNYIASNSLESSVDEIEINHPVPPPPPPVALHKIKQNLCPYYQDHTRYFKAITSEHDRICSRKSNLSFLSNVHRSDVNFAMKRNVGNQFESQTQNKTPFNSLNSSVCCNNTGIISYNNRPLSRNSLSSRFSSSHNSLSVPSANKADDSIFITQAMSHDALLTSEISDFYNVPIDSDIYALPVDMIRSEICFYNEVNKLGSDAYQNKANEKTLKSHRRVVRNKRRKKFGNEREKPELMQKNLLAYNPIQRSDMRDISVTNALPTNQETVNIGLDEIKQLYQSFYSNSSAEAAVIKSPNVETNVIKSSNETIWRVSSIRSIPSNITKENNDLNFKSVNNHNNSLTRNCEHQNQINSTQKKQKPNETHTSNSSTYNKQNINLDKKFQFNLNLKQKFCSIFRFRRNYSRCRERNPSKVEQNLFERIDENKSKLQSRALPPVPKKGDIQSDGESLILDKKPETQALQFTTSIQKVKDYGWYWGPLSCEAAEKVLSNEPDGSFIVRDSSDDHYIFSLSFKLNNCVRHVRIEQDQGTFSFGSYAKFKSQTITEFIEKAVEHSRSGRYLFFLHRRPEHGPMRVQLTNPVSRFKHVQSLQHMCRFIILKTVVRKDLVQALPLPRRLLDYLNYKHCYSEQVGSDNTQSQTSSEGSI